MIIDEENNNIFIIEKLNSLKNELNRDQVNLKSVQRDIKQLEAYDNASQYEYLNNLLDPKRIKGVKVPSKCPIPTCSFQMHNFITFRSTEHGFDVFGLNPFFLASNSAYGKTLNVNGTNYYMNSNFGTYFFCGQDDVLDGKTPVDNFYTPTDYCQNIPDVYAKYRLVSACIELRYIGQLDEASGVIGAGISYVKSNYLGFRLSTTRDGPGTWSARNPMYADYANFELIRDCTYSCENLCLEGLRMLYFPIDDSFLEFKKVFDASSKDIKSVGTYGGNRLFARLSDDCIKTGFNWLVYLEGVPYSESRNFRLDYYFNYECIPKPEFLNYMPITLNVTPHISSELFKKFIDEVQGKSIQKLNIY